MSAAVTLVHYEHRNRNDDERELDAARGKPVKACRTAVSAARRLRLACSFTLCAAVEKREDAPPWMRDPQYEVEEQSPPEELQDSTVWTSRHLEGLSPATMALLERVGDAMRETFDTGEFGASEAAREAKAACWRYRQQGRTTLAARAQDRENEARREITKSRKRLSRLHELLDERDALAHELVAAVLRKDDHETALAATRLLSHVESMRRRFSAPREWKSIKAPIKRLPGTAGVDSTLVHAIIVGNPRFRKTAWRFPDFENEVIAECAIRQVTTKGEMIRKAAEAVKQRLYRQSKDDAMSLLSNRDFSLELYGYLPDMSPSY